MGGRLTIRDDLGAACARAWQRIARRGTWWNGAQRIAIAAETRNALQCGLCRERKAALSPFAITGEHDGGGELPGPVVEVVHRVRTDSGRLTRAWYEGVLASGLSDAQYVEIVGVVATTSALDTFSRGIGVAPTPLPPPQPGEPTRHRPARAKQGIAWVPHPGALGHRRCGPGPLSGQIAGGGLQHSPRAEPRAGGGGRGSSIWTMCSTSRRPRFETSAASTGRSAMPR